MNKSSVHNRYTLPVVLVIALVIITSLLIMKGGVIDQGAALFTAATKIDTGKIGNLQPVPYQIVEKIKTTDPTAFLMGGIGGPTGQEYYNDVWSSKDFVNWINISPNNSNPGTTKWSQRGGQSALYFKNKLWVIGGQDSGGDPSNEVWSSPDGATWNLVGNLGTVPSSYRSDQAAVVFQDKMWVMGGHTGVTLWNDVLVSSDGATWVQKIASAPWSGRYGHSAVVYNGKLWVMGGAIGMGNFANDVWSSADGSNWVQVTNNAAWSPRFGSSLQVYNNKMYLIGGLTVSTTPVYTFPPTDEVWSSKDGITWIQVPQSQWPARSLAASAVVNKKMYILGGGSSVSSLRDIWSFDSSTWQLVSSNPAWNIRSRESVVVPQ